MFISYHRLTIKSKHFTSKILLKPKIDMKLNHMNTMTLNQWCTMQEIEQTRKLKFCMHIHNINTKMDMYPSWSILKMREVFDHDVFEQIWICYSDGGGLSIPRSAHYIEIALFQYNTLYDESKLPYIKSIIKGFLYLHVTVTSI